MKAADAIAWFDEIAVARSRVKNLGGTYYEHEPAVAWLTDAQSALAAVFPVNHTVQKRLDAILSGARKEGAHWLSFESVFEAAAAVFSSAHQQLKSGRISGLVEGIRAESVGEILEQAEALARDFTIAAAVLAGGALESHLLHLCQRHTLGWTGDGSISKYNGAIGQARNMGNEVYSANEGKLVEAWGGIRNDAAHKPTTFKWGEPEVRSMITGIRQLVARTA